MSIVLAPRSSTQRIAMRMRLRSSGGAFFSQNGLRHDAEHRAAVEIEEPVRDGDDVDVAEADGFRQLGARLRRAGATCFSSTSTPCALDGWMNATVAPSAPGLGLVVDEPDVALAAIAASAARMSSTRSVM